MHPNIFQTARRLILLFKLPSRWTGFSWLTCPGVGLYPAGEKSEPQVERLKLVPKPWRYVRSELSGNWNVTLPGLFPGVTDPGYAALSGVPGVWNIRLSAPGVLSSALSITPGDAGVSWDNRRKHKKFIAEIGGSRHFAHERLRHSSSNKLNAFYLIFIKQKKLKNKQSKLLGVFSREKKPSPYETNLVSERYSDYTTWPLCEQRCLIISNVRIWRA